MKNKKIVIIMVMIILISQLSMGITAFGEAVRKGETTIEMTEDTEIEDALETNKMSEESSDESIVEEESDENVTNIKAVEEKPKMAAANNRKIDLEVEQFNREIRLPLGSSKQQMDNSIRGQVKVDADGYRLSRDEYYIDDIQTDVDVDVISYRNGKIDYTIVPFDKEKYNSLRVTDVDVEIFYDRAIVLETDNDDRLAAAFNIDTPYGNEYDKYRLVTTSGKSKDNDYLDSSLGNNPFYKVDIFRKKDGEDYGYMEDSMSGDIKHYVNGNERKQDALKKWNNNTNIYQGDIIRTWTANPKHNNYYIDRNKYPNGPSYNGYTYYYIWSNQIIMFQFSQMNIHERIITTETSDEYLEKTIRNSFSKIGHLIEDIRFDSYPDRKQVGDTTAEITVRENEGSFGYIEYTFEVPFKVVEPRVEVDFKENLEFPVGTNMDVSNPADYIEAIYKDGEKEDIADYDVKLYPEYNVPFDNETVGRNQEMIVDIEAKYDEDLVYGDFIDLEFVWGNTISTKGVNSNDYDASISLLKDINGNPYFSANKGTGLTSKISTAPRVELYSESYTNRQKIDVKTSNNQNTNDAKNDFQKAFNNRNDIEYGDVLVYSVSNGGEILTSKGNEVTSEVEDFNEAFYEITPKGYHLLRLNQMDVKEEATTLGIGDNPDQVTEKLKGALIIPNDLEDSRDIRYEVNEKTIDVTKPSTGKKATLNVYEKLQAEDKEFMITYEIPYSVEQNISVELQEVKVPVGKKVNEINPRDYVKSVKAGDKTLNPSEYEVAFEKAPKTTKVGSEETKIKVLTNGGAVATTGLTKTNIVYGHSIVTKNKDGKLDVSISLLENNGKPYLSANEGTGLSSNTLSTRPFIYAYRENINTPLLEEAESGYASVTKPPEDTRSKWQTVFDKKDFRYGDVFGYKVDKHTPKEESEMGSNTWATRNEELKLETEGYAYAYYELTSAGFRLMHFNQITPKKEKLEVSLKTSKDDFNKQLINAFDLPNGVNQNDFRFEVVNVDTQTSGNKTGQVNIYEKLSTGKEFMSTTEIMYFVKPQVTEKFLDESGKELKKEVITELKSGQSYQGKPSNFLTVDGEVFSYQGWLPNGKQPGKDKPTVGNPPETKETATYQYIYTKASNMIDMTMPTEMLFGTENGKDVTSKDYEIKNNSNKVKTEVSLNEFKKETSEVKLLTSKEKDPTKSAQSARLNLTTNGKTAVGSLNDTTKNESITTLNPSEKASMGISGKYFGSQKESARIKYNMMLKFTVVPD